MATRPQFTFKPLIPRVLIMFGGSATALAVGLFVGLGYSASDLAAQAPSAAELAATRAAHVPILNFVDDNDFCRVKLTIQNLGEAPTAAILVAWGLPLAPTCGDDRAGPLKVECTGLIRPGSQWTLSDAQIPTGARSGTLYSLTPRRLSELGVMTPEDDLVSAFLCETLFYGAVQNAAAFAAFATAFRDGGTFAGVPMDRALGEPIAVQAARLCPGSLTPGVDVVGAYAGLTVAELGAADPSTGRYAYSLGAVHADDGDQASLIYAQNAGTACALVELWFQARGQCAAPRICSTASVAPGYLARPDPVDCLGPDVSGTVWLTSDQPLAIVADTIGPDTLTTHAAEAVPPEPAAGPPAKAERTILGGPILYRDFDAVRGTVDVAVTNLSPTTPTRVRVTFLGAGGETLTTSEQAICPRGNATFRHSSTSDPSQPDAFGSLRVESLGSAGEPAGPAPPISAVAEVVQFGPGAGGRFQTEALALNLEALPWAGESADVSAPATARLAVPLTAVDLSGDGIASELLLTNRTLTPGDTDAAILFYDQNALVAWRCRRLAAGQTLYYDLWFDLALPRGFTGAAVVSATAWTHGAQPAPGRTLPWVDLAAISLTRIGIFRGQDIPGDELAAVNARPWPADLPLDLNGRAPAASLCPGGSLPPRPSPGPTPAAPAAALAGEVHLPVVAYIGQDAACIARTVVTNRGDRPGKVIAIGYGEPSFCEPQSAGPTRVACSGLIEPGQVWIFDSFWIQSPELFSASLYSLDSRSLGELGVRPGSPVPAADAVCETLQAQAGGDADGTRRFTLAYRTGGAFGELPLDKLYGPPIVVTSERDCPAELTPGLSVTTSYAGIPHAAVLEPAPANDAAAGAYAYSLSQVLSDAPGVSILYIQNAGLACASIDLHFGGDGRRQAEAVCDITSLAPGEAYPFDASDCIGPSWVDSVVIYSDQPLALVAEDLRGDARDTHLGFNGDGPFDLDGDAAVDARDVALLDAANGATPGSPRWNRRYDLNYDGVIDAADRALLMRHLDSAVPTPTDSLTATPTRGAPPSSTVTPSPTNTAFPGTLTPTWTATPETAVIHLPVVERNP